MNLLHALPTAELFDVDDVVFYDGDDPRDPFSLGIVVDPSREDLAAAEDLIADFDVARPLYVLVEWPSYDAAQGDAYREWTPAARLTVLLFAEAAA